LARSRRDNDPKKSDAPSAARSVGPDPDTYAKRVQVELTPSELWTAKEAADYLRVSLSWIRHQTAAGLLPVVRFGAFVRYTPEQLAAYVRGEWRPKRG